MDFSSVTNPANWTITRANSTEGGYYNNMAPIKASEAMISTNPISVTYDSTSAQATIRFLVSQNSSGDATIDPKHLVFKFAGQDFSGRKMDTSADEFDGYKGQPF